MRILKAWPAVILVVVVAGWVLLYFRGKDRKPAAIESYRMTSPLDFKRTVIQQLDIHKVDDKGFEVSVNWPGDICQYFSSFDVVMEADGIAISGDPVQLQSTRPCSQDDRSTLQSAWQFGPHLAKAENFQMRNFSGVSWKQKWFVREIVMHGTDGTADVHINSYEIISMKQKPLSIKF